MIKSESKEDIVLNANPEDEDIISSVQIIGEIDDKILKLKFRGHGWQNPKFKVESSIYGHKNMDIKFINLK